MTRVTKTALNQTSFCHIAAPYKKGKEHIPGAAERGRRQKMKLSRTTLKLTAAALGVVALFAAGAAAGVSRGEDMRATGVTVDGPAIPMAQSAGEHRQRL